ncbi:gamma-glutamyltransferase, partial [Klebsiella sp. K5-306]|uniref:gamma-glutamyltransferase n=1 Tax=Klebsiella sp. K5-306 TaxID=2866562 RepID=UPI003F6E2333
MQSHVAAHGMAVAPHHLASQSALAVLREGGSAIEAMVAAAATIAVVYPHMNGLRPATPWITTAGRHSKAFTPPGNIQERYFASKKGPGWGPEDYF